WRAGRTWRTCTSLFLHAHPLDPRLEAGEQVGEELLRGLVGELAVGELARARADEHLGARQHVRPELAEDAPQVVLNARSAERPRRDGEQRHRLVLPG